MKLGFANNTFFFKFKPTSSITYTKISKNKLIIIDRKISLHLHFQSFLFSSTIEKNNNEKDSISFEFIENNFSKMNYYELLSVKENHKNNNNYNISKKEIKLKYFKLAKKFHPDQYKGNQAIFKKISEAYKVLLNDDLRGKYDLKNNLNTNTKTSNNQKEAHKYNIYKRYTDMYRKKKTKINENESENNDNHNENGTNNSQDFSEFDTSSKFKKDFESLNKNVLLNNFLKNKNEENLGQYKEYYEQSTNLNLNNKTFSKKDDNDYINKSNTIMNENISPKLINIDDKTIENISSIKIFKSEQEKKMNNKEKILATFTSEINKDNNFRSKINSYKESLSDMIFSVTKSPFQKEELKKIEDELNISYKDKVKNYSKKEYKFNLNEHKNESDYFQKSDKNENDVNSKIKNNDEFNKNKKLLLRFFILSNGLAIVYLLYNVFYNRKKQLDKEKEKNLQRLLRLY